MVTKLVTLYADLTADELQQILKRHDLSPEGVGGAGWANVALFEPDANRVLHYITQHVGVSAYVDA